MKHIKSTANLKLPSLDGAESMRTEAETPQESHRAQSNRQTGGSLDYLKKMKKLTRKINLSSTRCVAKFFKKIETVD